MLTNVGHFEGVNVFPNFLLGTGFKLICRQADPFLTLLLHYEELQGVPPGLEFAGIHYWDEDVKFLAENATISGLSNGVVPCNTGFL